MSKDKAKELGLKRYFTGIACKHGHISEKMVSNRQCCSCLAVAKSDWNRENPNKATATKRIWNSNNPEKLKASKQKYNDANKDKQAVRARRHYEKDKKKSFEAHYRWAERNPDKVNALSVKYYTDKMQRLPVWADLEAIEKIYYDCHKISQETGIEHHVDHIVPLRGKSVSGLHVEYNLQILTGRENQSKGNKLQAHERI